MPNINHHFFHREYGSGTGDYNRMKKKKKKNNKRKAREEQ